MSKAASTAFVMHPIASIFAGLAFIATLYRCQGRVVSATLAALAWISALAALVVDLVVVTVSSSFCSFAVIQWFYDNIAIGYSTICKTGRQLHSNAF